MRLSSAASGRRAANLLAGSRRLAPALRCGGARLARDGRAAGTVVSRGPVGRKRRGAASVGWIAAGGGCPRGRSSDGAGRLRIACRSRRPLHRAARCRQRGGGACRNQGRSCVRHEIFDHDVHVSGCCAAASRSLLRPFVRHERSFHFRGCKRGVCATSRANAHSGLSTGRLFIARCDRGPARRSFSTQSVFPCGIRCRLWRTQRNGRTGRHSVCTPAPRRSFSD